MPSILLNTDPTRTTLLRNQFVADMVRRFKAISKAIDVLILGDEALGLINPGVRSVDELIGNVEFQAWRFQTNPQKVKSFRRWLQTEIDDNILTTSGGVVDKPWTATYIEPAYKKGVTRARTDTGRAFPGIQGTKEEFLRMSFTGTIATSKVELLYERAFTELEGVTAAMDQQLSRLLAEGLSAGRSPRQIATALKNQVTKLTNVRAKAIARTEIIRAHAEGQLDSFEVLGVKELDLLAEWSTAGDERVCFECAELEGVVMTIDEARGLLPRHPNCRCAWIPANVNARLPGQLFGSDKTSAIQKSIRAEGGVTKENRFRKSFKTTRPGSSWLGKERVPRSAVPGAKRAVPRGPVPEPSTAPKKTVKKVSKDAKPLPKDLTEPIRIEELTKDLSSAIDPAKEIPAKITEWLTTKNKFRRWRVAAELDELGVTQSERIAMKAGRQKTLDKYFKPSAGSKVEVDYATKYKNWVDGLSREERELLSAWEDSRNVTESLFEFHSTGQDILVDAGDMSVQAFDKAFSKIIKRAPKVEGTYFRGVRLENLDIKKGNIIDFPSYSSLTSDEETAKFFASSFFDTETLTLESFEGPKAVYILKTKAVDLKAVTGIPEQSEFIMDKGKTFFVKATKLKKAVMPGDNKLSEYLEVILEEF